MAKLYFRYGAMNCGKTALLLQSVHNYEDRGKKVLVMKPIIDTKGNNKVVSRIGLERDVDHLIDKEEKLYDYIVSHDEDISCIFVDEAQFLKRDQVDDLLHVTVTEDIPVICFGLRTDFASKGFEGSTRLLELAHSIEEMKTICRCGKKATFNARMVDGEFVFDGDQVAIDGEKQVTYDSLCPKCYFEEKEKYFNKEKSKVLLKQRKNQF
ncbi:MAG: thymidine kinase [Bacilli bacterium]|nr:thymidine kinase [Bacilli bacterium]